MKDTPFYQKKTLNIRGKLVHLEQQKIMGILNLTPDSFYEESRVMDTGEVLRKAERMLQEGADFLDIGGYSTRPGAAEINEETETTRIIPAIELLAAKFPTAHLSVDTFRSGVARRAIDAGACMVNDISGGQLDADMLQTVASLKVPYILMHMQGTPQTMTGLTSYDDVTREVIYSLSDKLITLRKLGIADIIVDPGFGFAKTIEQNFELLKNLSFFSSFGYPVLAGLSRKSMIYKILKISPGESLNGTTVLNTFALLNQASILRVHDVREAKEILSLVNHLRL